MLWIPILLGKYRTTMISWAWVAKSYPSVSQHVDIYSILFNSIPHESKMLDPSEVRWMFHFNSSVMPEVTKQSKDDHLNDIHSRKMASSIPRPYDINTTTRHERISSPDKIPDCLSNWNELNLSLLVFIIGLIGSYWSNIQLVGAVNPWKQYLKTSLWKNAKTRNLSPQTESETRLHICLKATPQVSMKFGSRLRPLDVILTWDLETWIDSEDRWLGLMRN